MKKIYVLILSFSVLISSCAPTIYRTLSTEKSSEWQSGKQIVYKTNNKVDIAISHEEMNDQYSIYYLQVHNKSNENVLVDPGQFVIENGRFTDSSFVVNSIHRCIDPENKIQFLENDQKIADYNARKSAIEVRMALSKPVTAVPDKKKWDEKPNSNNSVKKNDSLAKTDKFADKKAEKEARERAEKEAAAQTKQKLETHQQNVQKVTDLAIEKDFWLNNAMRITTLHPNDDFQGMIAFPALKEKNKFILRLRFGNDEIPINFETIELEKER